MAHKFTISLVAAALLCGAAGPVRAAAGEGEVQLVQAGDGQKSCEALASEINALAQAKPVKKKKGFGGFGKMLSMAAPMLGGLGGSGIGGQLVNSAVGMAQSSAMEAQNQAVMDNAMAAAAPGQSVAAERKERLMGLFQSKGC